MRRCCQMLTVLAALFVTATAAHSQLKSGPGDWPGWRGPNRDNLSKETGLLPAWESTGPKLLWKAKGLGSGYSTPSIANGVLYLVGTEGKDVEQVIALDVKTGDRLWATPFGKTAGGYPGPRSTPTIDGNDLYVISSNGKLIAADVKKGDIKWQKDFRADFGGRAGNWAYTESPLIDGDVLVCTPGGDSSPIVALKKQSGEVIWKADLGELANSKKGYSTAGYSSVIVGTIAGVRQYVQFLSGGVVGIDARDGKVLWHYDHPANKTANISTPLQVGDAIFAASAYNTGGGLADIIPKGGKLEAKEAYFLDQMQNHHGGMVLLDGFIYGTNGGQLLCINAKEGKIVWQNKSVGKGAVVYADGHLIVRGEAGPVALVEANPKSYVEKSRFSQPERSKERAWAHPVVAGGKLYLRDQDLLFCYDVKSK